MRTMDRRYDEYGFATVTLEELAPLVQQLLGLPFVERESDYYAGTYYLHEQSDGRELRLYRNYDHALRSFVRDEYRDYAVILEVSALDNMDEIQQKLMNGQQPVVLLSSMALSAEPADEDLDPDSDSHR